jgi:phosphoglycolate phosphatase-like HAD superfamily hydrolase
LYQRFREEIVAVLSLLVPIIAGYLYSRVASDQIRAHLATHWASYVMALLLVVAVTYSWVARTRLRKARGALDHFAPRDEHRYRNVLDLTDGTYYLLGMSAEEFQRNVPVKDYLLERARTGRPIRELKFLLLHPDSDHFSNRLLEVNPDCNLKALIRRKKEIIRSLYLGLSSLPQGILQSFEIRFFDTYPVWIMEFFRSGKRPAAEASPDGLVLSFHLAGVHSKLSEQYLLRHEESGLFDSFLIYFQRKWETSLPMTPQGTFPKIYSPERQTTKLLIFDLDGTIIESNDAKKEVFFETYKEVSADQKKLLEELYRRSGSLPRADLFRQAEIALGRPQLSQERLKELQQEYSAAYASRVDQLTVVKGFDRFYQSLGTKYRFAIASNAPGDEVSDVLKRKKIYDYFGYVAGYPTSKAEAIRTTFKTFDLEPENVLYIGDTEEDRVVCDVFGIRFIARRHGDSGPTNIDYEYSFDDYDDLSRVIYKLELERFEAGGNPLPC